LVVVGGTIIIGVVCGYNQKLELSLLCRGGLEMTDEAMKFIQEIRDLGYAICIFTPEELNGAKPHKVEDELVSAGWDIIDNLATV
jgi:hypothetical protein